MLSSSSPAGRLESHQRGFWIETLVQMQKTKARNWLFPENVRRVERQSTKAGRFLLGYMHRNLQRGPWSLNTPCVCQLPSSWPYHGRESSHLLPASVQTRGTCFPCTASTFTPRIDSHHGGTWDSPVGKPRGKASWESLEGKTHIPRSTRREAWHCGYN